MSVLFSSSLDSYSKFCRYKMWDEKGKIKCIVRNITTWNKYIILYKCRGWKISKLWSTKLPKKIDIMRQVVHRQDEENCEWKSIVWLKWFLLMRVCLYLFSQFVSSLHYRIYIFFWYQHMIFAHCECQSVEGMLLFWRCTFSRNFMRCHAYFHECSHIINLWVGLIILYRTHTLIKSKCLHNVVKYIHTQSFVRLFTSSENGWNKKKLIEEKESTTEMRTNKSWR